MSLIRKLIDSHSPKMNPILANGVAAHQMRSAVQYLDNTMQSAAKSFPEGLKYEGCRECTPVEEHERIVARCRGRNSYDVAESSFYMIRFDMSFKGEKLNPIYINIPFIPEHDPFITINNSKYYVSPTLNDIVFSVTESSIFVRLLRDRMDFQRLTHHFETLTKKLELTSVIWCPIHKGRVRNPFVRGCTTNVHYLLARYGFSDAFKRFAGYVPIAGGNEINHETYPASDWVIVQSSTISKPKAVRSNDWFRPQIRLAIPKEHYNRDMISMLGGFFYVLDHFPNRMRPEWLDSKRQWKVMLGLLIFSGDKNEGELHENIDEHMRSLDEYLDVFVIQQLKDIGIEADNIYEILALLTRNFTEWSSAASDKITTLYGKELNVNYFLLFRITRHIFSSVFALNQVKNSRRTLDKDSIQKIFSRELTVNRIFKITVDNKEVNIPQSPNDSKTFRITSLMIPQSANESSTRAKTINLDDQSIRLHASLAEVGGYNTMSKNHPDGRHRLNLYADIDDKYKIVRKEKFIPLIDRTQNLIKIS